MGAGYDIRTTQFRDIYGRFLWEEPLRDNFTLYKPGQVLWRGDDTFRVVRCAVVDSTEQLNVERVQEDINVTEPHL